MKEETHDINEIIIRYLDGSAELEEKRPVSYTHLTLPTT